MEAINSYEKIHFKNIELIFNAGGAGGSCL
jgi:hypothetical protein